VAAGLNVLLRLPAAADDERIARDADRAGVRVEPLSMYAIRPSPPGLVIGYGRVHETALEPAIAALAAVIRHTVSRR
jgi:GntR family transcriptional regulator / MocR family aminotransferase